MIPAPHPDEDVYVSAYRGQVYLGLSQYMFLRRAIDYGIRIQRLPGRTPRFSWSDIVRVKQRLEAERSGTSAARLTELGSYQPATPIARPGHEQASCPASPFLVNRREIDYASYGLKRETGRGRHTSGPS